MKPLRSIRVIFFAISLAATSLFSLVSLASDDHWNQRYREALRSPQSQACEAFAALASESSDLQELALVRRELSCQGTDLSAVEKLIDDSSESWLHPLALQTGFEIAQRIGDHRAITKFAPSLIKTLRSQKKREAVIQTAIRSAQNQRNESKVRELQTLLYKISPRLHPNPPQSLMSRVAKDFQTNREWQKAADTYQSIFNRSRSWQEKLDAIDGVRKAIKEKYRSNDGATVEEFIAASKNFGEYAFKTYIEVSGLSLEENRKLVLAFFQYGRDMWSYLSPAELQIKSVREVVGRFLQRPRIHPVLKAEAFVLLARVSQNNLEYARGSQDAENAIELLQGTNANSPSWQQELYDSALWFNAFLLRKSGDLEGSLEKMQRVARQSTAGWARRRAQFWVARTHKQLGHEDQASRLYREFVSTHPHHYYSIWARYDAGISLTPVVPVEISNPQRPSGITVQRDKKIKSLVDVGESKMARLYMDQFISQNRVDMTALKYRSFTGDHATVVNNFFWKMKPAQKREMQDRYASMIYPTPHFDLVTENANRWPHIDRSYVYSIMRQESTYDPFTHSWADARGLLQLVPRVADLEKEKAGIQLNSYDELFLPEINIPIGTAALDTGFGRSHGNFIISTGSYNAGEPRVHRWWKRLYTGDVFEFLESIPTEETRLYIRLVTRNYIMFERLTASGPFRVPEKLFELFSYPASVQY